MKNLHKLLGIRIGKKDMICIVGAGGKTSVMFRLAQELSSRGMRVLVTTTTAIYYPDRKQYDQIFVSEEEAPELFDKESNSGITVLGRSVSSEGKLLGVNPEFLDIVFMKGIFDCIIVEGDGSKSRPVKAPARHEPVIPSRTGKLIGLIGLDSVGMEVCPEFVHRSELFCAITGCRENDIINSEMISRLVVHEEGLFKSAPAFSERYLVLNKADGEKEMETAADIAQKLSDKKHKLAGIIISSTRNSTFRCSPKSVSGIILASGLSRRMGTDKLLLTVNGIPLIERVIAAASQAGLEETILVCSNETIASIGRKYGMKIVDNTDPQLGQSRSVRLGVENSSRLSDGFMFFVGDQPFITAEIINRLIGRFMWEDCSAVVPLYNGKKGNPVIFSSSLREKLTSLNGDSGGRVLLEGLEGKIATVEFDDEKSGFDIDTREEYERVIRVEDENG